MAGPSGKVSRRWKRESRHGGNVRQSCSHPGNSARNKCDRQVLVATQTDIGK